MRFTKLVPQILMLSLIALGCRAKMGVKYDKKPAGAEDGSITVDQVPIINKSLSQNVPVSGTCAYEGTEIFAVATDGASTTPPSTANCANGTWATNVDATTLADGTDNIKVEAGYAGTDSLVSTTVSKDTTVAISINAIADIVQENNIGYPVSGTCETDGTGAVKLDANDMTTSIASVAVDCKGGKWSAKLNMSSLDTGKAHITVTAGHTDSAGNSDSASRKTSKKGFPPVFGDIAAQTFTQNVTIDTIMIANTGGVVRTCSAAPTLPAGLKLAVAGNTCAISGKPTVAAAKKTYKIKGTATDKSSDTVDVVIEVKGAKPPVFSNLTTAYSFTTTFTIPDIVFPNSGSPALACSSLPPLPEGLAVIAFNKTCQISGTPTAAAAETVYTITGVAADNSTGSATVKLTVVAVNPPVFAQPSPQTFTEFTAITPLTLVNTGGAAVTCTVTPPLPAGLALAVSGTTCEITGTPTTTAVLTTYTITGTAADTTTGTASVDMTIAAAIPPALANQAAQTYVTTVAVTPLIFTNTGGAVTSCSILPALPAGLTVSVSGGTCSITGTPSVQSGNTTYTVTGTAANSTFGTATVDIAVNLANPPVLANEPAQTWVTTKAITAVVFGNSGASVSSCNVTPNLPSGLNVSLSGNSCQISGTPTAAAALATYTITGTALDGSTASATIDITVNAANPPAIANENAKIYVETVAITPVDFVNNGAAAILCSSSPTLPNGLLLTVFGGTCRISGTPTTPTALATYTITATATDTTTDTATIDITVNVAVPPTITLTAVQASPTNAATINMTAQFSESVTGFTLADITVAGGTKGNFAAVDGDTYTFDITAPTGTVTVDIAGAVALNTYGLGNTAAPQFSIIYDGVAPTLTLTAGQSSPTNTSPLTITAQFSENITGFVVGDLVIGNGTAGNFVAVDSDTYTFEITPAAVGNVTIDLPLNAVQDPASNGNVAAAQLSVLFDNSKPTPVLSSAQTSPTNLATINVTVQFDETVTGFDVSDITVAGGTKGNFVAVDGDTYTFDITGLSGTVTVDIAAGLAQDAAGNTSNAATQFTMIYDVTGPTPSLSAAQTSPTNSSTINMTVQFDEPVTGFDLADITVANGTKGNFAAVDGDTYTFDITAPSGTVTVNVGSSAATDLAGNSSLAATQFSVAYDGAAPTVTVSAVQTSPTNISPINMTAQFSEAVTGFDQADLSVANGTIGNFVAVDADTYTFDITPSGVVSVDIAAAAAIDAAGNTNTAATPFTITYDTTGPSVVISSTQSDPTAATTIPVTVQFSEAVTGFDLSDIVVVNATKANFVAVDGDTYTFDMTSPVGTVTVDIAGSVALDAAGNANTAATQFDITYDNTLPTVTLSAAQTSPTNSTTINMTAQFSQNVTGFDLSDITVVNGTKGNFSAVDGDTYTFDITAPTGTVTVDIGAGAAQNGLLQGNSSATQFVIIYDNVAPTATLSAAQTSPTGSSTINMSVQFSEVVTGFDISDISVTNGSKGNFVNVDGDTYTFDITSPSGTVTVDIAGSVAQDAATNVNTAVSQFSIVYDGSAPTVSLSAAQTSPTNAATINMTVQFSESVTGFDLTDITVVGGTKGNFTAVDADTYTFDITSPTGTITVDVAGGAAQDAAANGNTAATQFSIVYDGTAPTVTLSAAQTSPTNSSTINMTVQFSEPVTGFSLADITVTNGSKGNFAAVDGDTYTFDVTAPTGTITIDVAGGVAQDSAGNNNSAATQFSISYDVTAPTVALSAAQSNPTSSATINMTVQFSEAVSGFAIADITVVGGTKGNFVAVDGDTYTFDITSPSGTLTVDVAGGVAQDAAGNGNTAATQFSIVYDGAAPTVALTAVQASPTNATTINMTAQFSEAVTGFSLSDITVVNGTKGNFTAVDGDTYTFDITAPSGTVTVDVGAGAALDSALNGNLAASQFTIIFDNVTPTVALNAAQTSPTNASTINMTVQFSETVTGFDISDITVANGSKGNFAVVDGDTYTFDITAPTGTVTVNIAGAAAQDAATNASTAATQFSIVYDGAAPTVALSAAQSSPTNSSTINMTVQFSEPVTGFDIADITVANGTKGNFSAVDADTYTFDITAPTGTVTVDIGAGVAQDASTNGNTAASQFSIIYDNTAPSVALSAAQTSPTGASTINMTVQFSELVAGFDIGDITVTNGSKGNFVAVDGDTYTFDITAPSGTVTVNIASAVAADLAGNGNAAATQFSIVHDVSGPTVALSAAQSSPTNSSTINMTVQFSEVVTGFDISDITVAGGTKGNFSAVDGDTYTFDITAPTGTVTVDVGAGAAQDAALNNNLAATQFSIVYDGSAPTVTLTAAQTSPTNAATINMTVQFSEPVTGFDITDVTVLNGTKGNFSAIDGDTYTFDIISPSGTVTVDVGASAAQDAAANGNQAASQFSIVYDNGAPTVALSAAQTSPTNAATINMTVQFSEAVTGFDLADVTVTNGSKGNFAAIDGDTYTFDITSPSGTVTVDVGAGVAQDAATNANTAATQFSIVYDNAGPTIALSATQTSPTNASTINMTVQFSESVTGFDLTDVTVANGVKGNFNAVDGDTYTFDITSPTGTITVNIAGGIAQDAASNNNAAASQFSIVYDGVAPTVAITSTEASPTAATTIPVTVQFSENVTGFTLADITVVNASKTNFVAVDGDTYTFDLTSPSGTVTVDIASAVAQDSAGNANGAATQFSITYDGTVPTVILSATQSNPTNASTINMTAQFSTAMTGFDVSDITVVGGTKGNFVAVDGDTYTFDVTSATGTVTVDIPADAAQNVLSVGNAAATQFSIVIDTVQPTVSLSAAQTSPTNASTINVTVQFSEGMTGFDISDILVANGTKGNFVAVDADTYTFDITSPSGTVTVDVAAGVAQDLASNLNLAAGQLSVIYDGTAPGVALSAAQSSPTNSSTINMTVQFTEGVTGFALTDITVVGGSKGNFAAIDADTYTFDITSPSGTVTVDVAAGIAQDAAGNANTAATQFSITYDNGQPGAALSATQTSPTNASTINMTVQFTEVVTGFDISDITVTNGSKGNFAAVDGDTYTFDITSPSGTVTVDVAGGVAQDAASNGNTAASQFSIVHDGTAPTVALSSAQTSPTNATTINMTAQFSETVTGFDLTDITVIGGTKGNFVAVDGDTYTFDITSPSGTVTVDIASAVAQDAASNGNTAAAQFSIIHDGGAPTVALSAAQSSPTNATTINMTVQFSELVTGFDIGDITVGNGSKGNFAAVDGDTYTFDITSPTGTVTVDIAGGVAQDLALNANTAATQFSIVYDNTSPTVTISAVQTSPTNASTINMTVQFSEAVTGFDLSDISVANGSKGNFVAVDGNTYTFDITSPSGTVTVDIAGAVANDVAGNASTAASQFSINIDNTAPSVALSAAQSSPTSATTINMTAQFSEVVTGFDLSAITVTNGTKGNFVAVDSDTYTFDITAPSGTVTVDIAGGVAQDAATNGNTAATQFTIIHDSGAPTVTLSAAQTSPTNAATINMTVQFSEAVTGFDLTDITVGGGSKGNFVAVDGDTYTFDITSPSGTVTADVAAGVAQDAAANGNAAAAQFSIIFDNTAPTAVLSAAQTSPTNAATINMTVQFSEAVTGFDIGDITVTNGTKGNFSAVDADTYTFDITSPSGTVSVDVAGGSAQDAATNGNAAATQFQIVYDGTGPGVSLSAAQTSPTSATTINMTVQFTESVTGFDVTDINVVNGTKGNFVAVDGDTYTFDITSPSGTVTVDVAGGVAQDAATNGNTAATQFSIVYDGGAPTVALSAAQSSPTNSATINMTVQFSEVVTGFDLSDITVVNGSKGNFVAVDGDTYTFDITSPSGTVTADIAGGVAQDAALNGNSAATQFSIIYDGTPPSVVLSAAQSSPTNATTINMTAQFSETVTGFTLADLTVVNGTAGNFVAVDGDTYTFDITSPSGTVTVDIAGGAAQDAASNGNTAATQFAITYDGSAPTVALSAVQTSPTNASTINMTIQFNEPVTGFALTDITVTNGSKGNFVAVDGDTYTFDITSPSGTVTVDVAAGVAQDSSLNGNTAATQFQIVYDSTAPGVSLSAAQTSPTNSATINMTVQFTEAVTGFDLTDITVGNGTKGNFSAVDGDTYTFDITPNTGTVTVDIGGSSAQDAAGNGNTAASQFQIVYDNSAPTVALSAAQTSPTSASTINMTVQFSEPVSGFDLSDITVGNGTKGNFVAVDGDTYTFDITSPSGTVTVDVAAGVAQDAATNGNTAATQFSILYDVGAPTVALSAAQTSPTNSTTINMTVQFSELVTGFDVSDISVANGTKGNFVAVDGDTYTFDITSPTGTVTVDVAGGVAQDLATNGNTAASQFQIVYDNSAPTVSLSAAQSSPTNASTINMTVQFSETVTGFDLTDITVANGTKGNFVAVDGDTYTFDITSASGSVTVDIAGGVAQDAATNGNTAATQFSILHDSASPTVALSATQSSPTSAATINMTVQFSENVTGFDLSDITVGNGTKGNFTAVDGDTFTFDITSPSGTVTVDIAAAVAQDAAGNNNTAATQFQIVHDSGAPTIALSAAQSSPTNASTINMTVQFSETVTGFDLTDITVGGGTKGNFTAVDGDTYTFDITSPSGTVTVDVAADAAQDAASNGNVAATQFSIVYDGTAPTVALSAAQTSPTNSATINMTVQFSETVTGFDLTDITVAGGTKGNFIAIDGDTYTFDITSPSGTVTVDVAGGVAQDAAANGNTAATQFSLLYDGAAPTVALSSAQSSPTSFTTINMTVQFSENVTGFDVSDITVTNGTKANFVAVDGDTYTFDITSPSGTVSVNVAGGVAQDAAGNGNTAATQFQIVYDGGSPTIALSSAQTSPTNSGTINMTVQFSEAVTGFDLADITVVNGTKGNFTAVDGDTYTFDITSPSATVTVDVAAGVAQDAASNGNLAATQFTIVYDNTAPTVSLSSAQTSPTNSSTINITVQFSETVTGFDLSDISVANGTKGNFAAVDGDTYTFDITAPSGTITVDVAGGVAQDSATNGNAAATQLAVTYDGSAPSVALSAAQSSPTSATTINMTVQFSEPVSGFDLTDITVANGTKGNFVAVDGDTYTFDITAPSGTVTVDVAGGVAQDGASNNNTAATQFQIVYDGGAPSVALSATQTSPTNASTINMTAQFSESVTGFDLADITVVNGTKGNFVAVDGDTYTFDITSPSGVVTVDIAAGVAQDGASNGNTAATQFQITYDGSAPTVALSAAQTSPTNSTTINMTVQFSETVTGFDLTDITVANGTKGNFVAVDGDTYTFDITAPSGTVTVDIAGSVAQDAASNNNTAATQFSIVYDGTAPTVALSATQSSPTNSATINMTVQFSEPVTGFDLTDISVANGTKGNFTAVDGDTYTFDITSPTGTVTVDVAGGLAQDTATNGNTAATQFSILHDAGAPGVVLSAAQSSPTNATTINMTAQFSESVTGFDLSDISVANGTKGNFVAVDGDTYTFDITSPSGTVTVDIAGGVAQDAASNGNAAATQFFITYDGAAPTVALSAAQSSPTSATTINMTVQFSEPVTGFDLTDITVGNGTKGNFAAIDGDTYTFDITAPSGTVTVDIGASAAQDAASNSSTAATQFQIVYDGGAPTVALSATQTSPTNSSTINMTVQFSEVVTGFDLTDVTVVNGTKGNFSAVDGDTYTFDITSPSGTVTVDIAAGVAQDAAANNNTAATQFQIVYDGTAPSVSLSAGQTSPTNASTINMTVQFSETVTGFDLADITVVNGTKGNFAAVDGDTYTFDITSPSGTVTVDVTGSVAQDAAGNNNTAATQFQITHDSGAPTVALSSSQTSPTNSATINMTVQFSETVTGFDLGDVSVANGTKGNFVAIDGDTYTFDITSPSGTVTVDVAGGVAQDGASNGNTAATQFQIVYDATAPTVALSAGQTSPTNSSTINMTVQFSEPVTGFDLTDVAVTNGTKGNFVSVDGDTYTFDITSPSGTVTVDVAGSVAQDAASNNNTAATQFSIIYDGTAPTIALSAAQSSPTSATTINMTVQFSEPVTGFDLTDITVANGTKGNFSAIDGDTYTFDITAPNGAVTVDIAGGVAQDSANNNNAAATQFQITYDNSAPTVTLSAAQSSPTNASTINITAQFSEVVTGFDIGDITVANGSKGNFVAVDGDTYTFDITGPSGTVTVNIAGGVAQDAALNGNTAATQLSITYDGTAPTVGLSAAQTSPTTATTINMTIQFSETVTGFDLSDISVANGTKGNFAAVDGDTYTFDITSPAGTVTVDVAGGVAQDSAGNGNTAASQFTIVYDNSQPSVALSAAQTSPTNAATINMTVQFSENVTGFDISDITVANGTKGNFSAVDGDTYTFDITSPSGTVTVNIAGGVAQDSASNGNTAAPQFSIVYDNSAPTTSLSAGQTSPTNTSTINMTVQFSETVTGFDLSDITVTNGTKGNFSAVDGDTYTFDITSPSGTVTVNVAGGVAQDAAGNGNTAATQFSIVYDGAAPTVSLSAVQSSPTSSTTINMTAQFSEAVTDFTLADIAVTNGTKGNFVAVDSDTYTFDITAPSGTVTVNIAGGVAFDLASNGNSAATQFSIVYDNVQPTVVLTAVQSSPTNASTINMTAQFSESVTGFTLADITVANGTKGSFVEVDGDTYTFNITAPSGTVTVNIAGGVAQDAANNSNTAATQFSIVYDNTQPTVVLTAVQSSPTNASTINMTAQFSETVTGFTLSDIVVANGTKGSFVAVDGDTYTFNITAPTGTVTVNIAGGVAQDSATNGNVAASQFSIVYDGTAPTVAITSTESSPTSATTIPITVQFSETVTGFAIGDIAVVNGTKGNFVAVDGDTYTFDITSPSGTVTVNIAGAVAHDTAGNGNTAATQFSIDVAADPDHVEITTSPANTAINTCSQAVTVALHNPAHGAVSATGTLRIALSGLTAGTTFTLWDNAGCTTQNGITDGGSYYSVDFSGQSSRSLYFKATTKSTPLLTATWDPSGININTTQGMTFGSATDAVTQLAFTRAGDGAPNACNQVVVETRAADGIAETVTNNIDVVVSLDNNGIGQLYTVSNCASGGASSKTVTIASASSSVTLYYKSAASANFDTVTAAESPNYGWTDASAFVPVAAEGEPIYSANTNTTSGKDEMFGGVYSPYDDGTYTPKVIMVGTSLGSNVDLSVHTFNPDLTGGTEVYTADGGGSGSDYFYDVTTDPATGDYFAVGKVRKSVSGCSGDITKDQLYISKFDKTDSLVDDRTICVEGTALTTSSVHGVLFRNEGGSKYLYWLSDGGNNSGTITPKNLYLRKLNASNLTTSWEYSVSTADIANSNGGAINRAIASDSSGNIYVAGVHVATTTDYRLKIRKFGPSDNTPDATYTQGTAQTTLGGVGTGIATGTYNGSEYLWSVVKTGGTTSLWTFAIQKHNLSDLTLNTSGGCHGTAFSTDGWGISDVKKLGDYLIVVGAKWDHFSGTSTRDAAMWVFKTETGGGCTHSTTSGAWRFTGGTYDHIFGHATAGAGETMNFVTPGPSPSNAFYTGSSLSVGGSTTDLEILSHYWYVPQ